MGASFFDRLWSSIRRRFQVDRQFISESIQEGNRLRVLNLLLSLRLAFKSTTWTWCRRESFSTKKRTPRCHQTFNQSQSEEEHSVYSRRSKFAHTLSHKKSLGDLAVSVGCRIERETHSYDCILETREEDNHKRIVFQRGTRRRNSLSTKDWFGNHPTTQAPSRAPHAWR